MCWTQFKIIGHSLTILGPSQKTLRLYWCPKLVTGLLDSMIVAFYVLILGQWSMVYCFI